MGQYHRKNVIISRAETVKSIPIKVEEEPICTEGNCHLCIDNTSQKVPEKGGEITERGGFTWHLLNVS